MVIVYVLASLFGSVVTFVALSSYGWAIALLCAPWGGSAVAGLAAVGVCILKAEEASVAPGALSNQAS